MECQLIVNQPKNEAYLYTPERFILGSLDYDIKTQGCRVNYEKGLGYLDRERSENAMSFYSICIESGIKKDELKLLRTMDLTDKQIKELMKQGAKLEWTNEKNKAKEIEKLDGLVQELLS